MYLSTSEKNQTLKDLAKLVFKHKAEIIAHNQQDIQDAANIDVTLFDRLKVDGKKVDGMVTSIEEVIKFDDPQGKILHEYHHPDGMLVQNKVVPFGRILIIYESRPDVTIEAAVSAFKAGNSIMLKGGKEAKNTNLYLVKLWHLALQQNNITRDYVTYLDISREETQKLLAENTHNVDLIIPRGGEGLLDYVKKNTSVPVIISGRGNNFIYVHSDADFDMAVDLIINGKSRLSVCNAIDKVLFNTDIEYLTLKISTLVDKLSETGIEIFGEGDLLTGIDGIKEIEHEEMWNEEFLSAKILFGLSASLRDAINIINTHSGGHSAVIVTADSHTAGRFQNEVDCAAVFHNASSRFTDGGQFGFGAEMAISTQKLHFRGPVGIGQLVSNKWFISGNGNIRD
jgi:glutamate-5-semialdehyde dehydrogenase